MHTIIINLFCLWTCSLKPYNKTNELDLLLIWWAFKINEAVEQAVDPMGERVDDGKRKTDKSNNTKTRSKSKCFIWIQHEYRTTNQSIYLRNQPNWKPYEHVKIWIFRRKKKLMNLTRNLLGEPLHHRERRLYQRYRQFYDHRHAQAARTQAAQQYPAINRHVQFFVRIYNP